MLRRAVYGQLTRRNFRHRSHSLQLVFSSGFRLVFTSSRSSWFALALSYSSFTHLSCEGLFVLAVFRSSWFAPGGGFLRFGESHRFSNKNRHFSNNLPVSNKQESSLPLLQTRLGRLASGLTERLRRFSRLPQAASFALTFPVIVFFCIRS